MDAQSVYASRQLAEAVALQVGGLLRSRPATWAKADHVIAHVKKWLHASTKNARTPNTIHASELMRTRK